MHIDETQIVLFNFLEASHFSIPENTVGNFPLQITSSTVSDIPDNWLQVRRLLNYVLKFISSLKLHLLDCISISLDGSLKKSENKQSFNLYLVLSNS